MDSDPIDTEISEEINQAEEDANAPPPETIIVKRGRPAGSKNKAKAVSEYNPTIVSESQPLAPIPMASQPDPMYTALMKRLDAMDGMLAQRQAEIAKKEKAPPEDQGKREWKGIYHRSQLRKRNLESRDHQGPHPDS